MELPKHVLITEVGPRDGLQTEAQTVPTHDKLALIAGLAAAGLASIQVASFVHPLKMPQMADAEAVIERLPRDDKVQYSALVLNHKGVERAVRTTIPWIEVSISASDPHSRSNAGIPKDRIQDEVDKMMGTVLGAGRKVRASIQCTFGCSENDRVPEDEIHRLAGMLLGYGIDQLVLADTTGMATPIKIRHLLEVILPMAEKVPVGLHLHDTRGLGLVNVMAGLQMGISRFDTSLGGLGGCPFVAGAAGNIPTEDTVYLMDSLGISTGIDVQKVSPWSHCFSRFFGRALPGKIYRLKMG